MPDTVFLSHTAISTITADAQPQFIIKMGDVYYLTLAVWEFDFAHAKTDAQRTSVAAMGNNFNDITTGDLVARQLVGGPTGGDPNQTSA